MDICRTVSRCLAIALLLTALSSQGMATTHLEVQQRVDSDLSMDKPLVVHLVVALCDNKYQGIVPVPGFLGNGTKPDTNLYWGAQFGARTFLSRNAGWTRLASGATDGNFARDSRVIERLVLYQNLPRGGRNVPVYLIADAWDGQEIEAATRHFLTMAAGHALETIQVRRGQAPALPGAAGDHVPRQNEALMQLNAGGDAHVVAYIGHDGLMDFSLSAIPSERADAPTRSAIVLACASQQYFGSLLGTAGTYPLLLTTGLMAPEAYTLDAALRAWASGALPTATRDAAAVAYHRYQKCGLGAARRLFVSGS